MADADRAAQRPPEDPLDQSLELELPAVLDMRMPGLDGREVVRRMRQTELSTRVLFVSDYHGGELVLQALTAGGADYLSQAASADEICSSIVRIANAPAVKIHIQNLYGKLGVNDRGAAVAEAMRRGLLS